MSFSRLHTLMTTTAVTGVLSTALVLGTVTPAHAADIPRINISNVDAALSSQDMSGSDRAKILSIFGALATLWVASSTVVLVNAYNSLVDMNVIYPAQVPPFSR